MKKTIPLFRPFIAHDAINIVKNTFDSNWVGTGKKVEYFEELVSKYIENNNFLALNSCTSSINLALNIAGITLDDEVITTPMTCVATNIPIMQAQAKIVWADISPVNGNILAKSIQEKITDRTKAIVVVHYGGYPCDMEMINQIAVQKNICVVEDAAHAFGSTYNGKMIGSHSDFICFSFQSVKTITTIDGGGLACKSWENYNLARKLRWYGIDRSTGNFLDTDIPIIGFRYTLNDVLASVGIANMQFVEKLINKRQEIATTYISELKNVNGLDICHRLDEQKCSSYYLFPVLVPDKEQFITLMHSEGIECSPVHRRNDLYSAFNKYLCDDLPGVELWDKKMVCLPIGNWLNDDDVWRVVKTIKSGF